MESAEKNIYNQALKLDTGFYSWPVIHTESMGKVYF
jgi:hypothetical protein